MDYVPLILVALIGGSVAGTAWAILRVPAKLVGLGERVAAVEREVAELDGKVKKCLRRVGIEERKARKPSESTPAPSPPEDQPGLPFPEADDSEDPLGDAEARIARLNGAILRKARARGRR